MARKSGAILGAAFVWRLAIFKIAIMAVLFASFDGLTHLVSTAHAANSAPINARLPALDPACLSKPKKIITAEIRDRNAPEDRAALALESFHVMMKTAERVCIPGVQS